MLLLEYPNLILRYKNKLNKRSKLTIIFPDFLINFHSWYALPGSLNPNFKQRVLTPPLHNRVQFSDRDQEIGNEVGCGGLFLLLRSVCEFLLRARPCGAVLTPSGIVHGVLTPGVEPCAALWTKHSAPRS
jgi:hypothetical protein